jgi:hypothetical protein
VTIDAQVPERTVAAGAPAKVRKLLAGRAADWISHQTSASLVQARAYRRDNLGDPQHHELKTASRGRKATTVIA